MRHRFNFKPLKWDEGMNDGVVFDCGSMMLEPYKCKLNFDDKQSETFSLENVIVKKYFFSNLFRKVK